LPFQNDLLKVVYTTHDRYKKNHNLMESTYMSSQFRSFMNVIKMRFRKPPAAEAPTQPGGMTVGPATLKDDGYHFHQYQDSPHAFWYTEWWYFNFIDDESGLAGMATIAVFDPGNHDGLATANLTASVFKLGEGKPKPIIEYSRGKDFTASPDQADVSLLNSKIEVISDTVYRVVVVPQHSSTRMDLEFKSADEPAMLAHDVHGSGWDTSSWLSYMPSAVVSGTLEYEGRKYTLTNARGYHDHDWGMWEEYKRTWSWAQFCAPEKNLNFDFGFHAAFQVSVAYLRYGDERLAFNQDKFKITQEKYRRWKLFWKYPTIMSFKGEDTTGRYKLVLNWKVLDTLSLWKYPVIVFEQNAQFNGTIYRLEDGQWAECCTIDESGFCEFTNTWL